MKSTYIATVFACLSLLGIIGFVTYRELRKPEKKPTTSQASSSPSEDKKTPQTDSVTLGQQTNNTNSTSIPLNANPQSTQPQNTSQPKLLDPSEFGQYDSYVNSDRYLSIDSKAGTGASAVSGKKVAVYYKGWLTSGEVFDESRPDESGKLQPFIFTPGAGQVIPGWEQGIIGMKVGGTRRLVLPPVAGYGEQGQGAIPPNAVLIFDIQLLEVEQ